VGDPGIQSWLGRFGQADKRVSCLTAAKLPRIRSEHDVPPAPRDQRYRWACRFGAACPVRCVETGLVPPVSTGHAMTQHLADISRQVAPGAHAVVTLDGAGWHQPGGKLQVPDNLSLLPLPPYSPGLNPVENVWQFLRQNHLSNRVCDTHEVIVDACCDAWNALIAEPARITTITTRAWAVRE
jgi:hypothetical protein